MRRNTIRQKASAEKVVKDIRRATRRHYGAEEKIRIVLEGLRGEDSIAAGSAAAQTYGFGTMGEGTNSYSTGSAITKLMVEELGLEARVQPSGGTTDFLPLLNAGELDFGIANVLETAQAHRGEGPWSGAAQDNIRVVAAVAPLRVAVFVAADSDINTMADLAGKRVTTQFSRIQTLGIVFPALLANAGLTLDDIVEVPVRPIMTGSSPGRRAASRRQRHLSVVNP